MSLLTDEGLPDPSNMNFFLQMTLGQLEGWWAQTQELGAALGLDGWSGPDAEQHRQWLLQDHQSTQQHQDVMHVVAELIMWAIDTLQLIMTILFIIQIIRAIILACSTIAAIFTAGFSEAVAADMAIQLAIMEAIKKAIIFALRQMLKLLFQALPKLLLRLLPGELAGATTGAVVAANTVSSQHLSGGAAAGVFLQDIGFGALTGATLQAGLSSGNPLAWKLLGAGATTTGLHVWAQSEVTGQGPTMQSVFDAANADIGLPEGTLALAHAAGEVGAFGTRLRLGRQVEGAVGVETQCGPAALFDKLKLAGKPQTLDVLSADAGWRPGGGMWLSEGGPKAMAGAIARDPSILEGMGASRQVMTVARRAQAGDAAALAQLEASFRFKGEQTLNDLDRAYTSTGMTVTVVTKLDDGAHAMEFAGLRDGRVFLVDGSTGKVRSLAAAAFLHEWRGGQALMPDLEALGIQPKITRLNPLTRVYERMSGLDEVRAIAPKTVDELPVLGASSQVNPDPKNPAPYGQVISRDVHDATLRAAADQATLDKRNNTVADAAIRSGKSPFITDQPASGVGPARNIGDTHAEHRVIYPDDINDHREVLTRWLEQHPGDAQVDLVTENLPCPGLCTPKILYGDWTRDLQAAAGDAGNVHFRVWHHGMGKVIPGGRIEGDLSLYSYELAPQRDAAGNITRRLYISQEMQKKMGYDVAAQQPLPPAPKAVNAGITARTLWTREGQGAQGIAFDDDIHYLAPPQNLQIISQQQLEAILRQQLQDDLAQLARQQGAVGARQVIMRQPDLQAFMKALMGDRAYDAYLASLASQP